MTCSPESGSWGMRVLCTFCKRSEQQVRKLVAGPGVYICDRCTERAHAIIHEGAPPSSPSTLWQRLTGRLRRLLATRAGSLDLRRADGHAV